MSKIAKNKAKKLAAAKGKFKGDQVINLLNRPAGATIAEVIKATNWQAHSVRAFMATSLKKKGHDLYGDVDTGGLPHYHIKARAA